MVYIYVSYKDIVNYLIAHDMDFGQFAELYEDKFGKKPTKSIVNKAIEYYNTGV